jgi:hypothetical protein
MMHINVKDMKQNAFPTSRITLLPTLFINILLKIEANKLTTPPITLVRLIRVLLLLVIAPTITPA